MEVDPAAEPVAVYDEAGAVVGVAPRGEVYARSLWHGVGGVLVRSGDGRRVYVHRRSATKLVMPGLHDCWAGGVIGPGEDPAATAARELAEELGVVGPEPRFLFKHRYRGAENPSWSAVFEVTWDGPVRPQASEIAWGAFLADDELLARLEEWPFVPDGLEAYRRYLAERR
jgi:8-oxo-dGTP pyrophosphatase MutT (NUDIX family)